MNFAIIAAGEGSRLKQEGATVSKPLTLLNGDVMIERLIRIFMKNGASSISIIINEKDDKLKKFLRHLQENWPINVVIKSTTSSMHSFFELSPFLKSGKFCLTTVDTIFREDEFETFINAFKESDEDGYMAVTDYIDDEKPLYVSTDKSLHITGFHDSYSPEYRYVSGGIYCLKPKSIEILKRCVANQMSCMRNFQRQLIAENFSLKAYPFSKILDVDHVSDIKKAEEFLNQVSNTTE